MSRKNNEKFLGKFLELDRLCCERFGVATNGVSEYINRLNNARFAPNRDEVLPKLVKYRNLRNRFAHEPQAIRKTDEVAKADIKWVKKFRKSVKKKNDPISKYLKKARSFVRGRRLRRFLLGTVVVAAVAVAVCFVLGVF